MAYRLLSRSSRSLTPAAGTAVAIAWMGEQSSSRMTSSIASKTMTTSSRFFTRQQQKVFSTTSKNTSSSTESAAASVAASAASATAKSSNKQTFLQWYEGHLEAMPVVTKMVTGLCLWSVGDAVAQIAPKVSAGENVDMALITNYDWPRTGRAAVFGFALHAPSSHFHFNFLEWMTVRSGVTGLGIPVFKAFMEQVRIAL
jgi:hypothetical protein